MLTREPLGDGVQLRLRLLERDAGLDASDDAQEVGAPAESSRIERHRYPEITRVKFANRCRCHTDHLVRYGVQDDVLTQDGGITAKPIPPQLVTHDDRLGTIGAVLIGGE